MSKTPAKKGWGVFKLPESDSWDPVADADTLFKAMKGVGTDEKELIKIICGRNREYLEKVKSVFKERYEKDLLAVISAETSYRFKKVLIAQLTPRDEWLAHLTKEAFKGAGVKARELVSVICTRTGFEMIELCAAYKKKYGTDLKKDLEKEVHAPLLRKFLIRICDGDRDPNEFEVDAALAAEDAKKLFSAGEGKLGTDEGAFLNIMSSRSHAHLAAVSRGYADLTGKPLQQAIKKEFTGPIKKALNTCAMSIGEYFAEALAEAFKGAGTDDSMVLNILTQLNFDELRMVNQWFLTKYKKTLHVAITEEFSGDLKAAYLYLVPSTL